MTLIVTTNVTIRRLPTVPSWGGIAVALSPSPAALAASSGSQREASLGIWRGDGERRRAELVIWGGIALLAGAYGEWFDGELYGGFVL